MHRHLSIAAIVVGITLFANAQWVSYRDPATPRTKDGKPNLFAPPPRAANGKPDLSGVWYVQSTPAEELKRQFGDLSAFAVPGDDPGTFNKYFLDILADFKFDQEPVRPEFAGLLRHRAANSGADHPTTHCQPMGAPANMISPAPFKFIQTPTVIAMLFEGFEGQRQIYLDGRKRPGDAAPTWLGYATGKWEGRTLVVNTDGFNDKSWLDAFGHPHSEALRVVQRFQRRDFGHMDVEVTIDDPKVYTQSFAVKFTELLQPDTDILEYICNENERDRIHLEQR
jgi:hypothetical protein